MAYEEIIKDILKEELSKISPELHQNIIEYVIDLNQDELDDIINNVNKDISIKTIKFSLSDLFNMSEDELKSTLLNDDNYNDYIDLFNMIYNKCVAKKNGENEYISNEEKEIILNKMNEYLENMEDYNKKQAQYYYADLIINLDYLNGSDLLSIPVHDVTSNVR